MNFKIYIDISNPEDQKLPNHMPQKRNAATAPVNAQYGFVTIQNYWSPL